MEYTQIILLVGFSIVITLLMYSAQGVEKFRDIAVVGLFVFIALTVVTLLIYFLLVGSMSAF